MLFTLGGLGAGCQALLQLVHVVVYLLAHLAIVGQQSDPQIFQLLLDLL